MVTPTNLLEAVKVPLFLQTSRKPTEVLSLCQTFKEFQKKLQELVISSISMLPTNPLWPLVPLKNPKHNFSKINCEDCDKVYISQTSRALRSRTREHKRVIFNGDRNSLSTQHCIKNNHDFDLDDVKIIDRCSQWSKRLFLEAWHSIHELNDINEHIYISDIYKYLGNPKWHFYGSFKVTVDPQECPTENCSYAPR